MTDDLTTWLRAQLDDDERVARETPDESRSWTHRSFVDYSTPDLPQDDHTLWFGDRIVGEVGFGDGEILPDEADHIARHDPARVLAEVDAKRRIMDIHHPTQFGGYLPQVCDGCGYEGICDDPVTEDINSCPILRALALPYADRPGYRTEWKP